MPRDRCLPAASDLLRQSACWQRLRAGRFHHRRTRRHGLGHGISAWWNVRRRGRESLRSLSWRIARTDWYLRDVHPRAALSAERPVWGAGMKGITVPWILTIVAALATLPLLTASNVVLNFLIVTLLIALVAQGWNVLGGYGGQYSFGHAAFFGTGAYVTAIMQMRYGVNAWAAFAVGIGGGEIAGLAQPQQETCAAEAQRGRREAVHHGGNAPPPQRQGVAQARPHAVDEAAHAEQADGVCGLEGHDDQPVLRLAPAHLLLQRGRQDAQDLPVGIIHRGGEEQQRANSPAEMAGRHSLSA